MKPPLTPSLTPGMPEMPDSVGYVQWTTPDGWISSSVPTKQYFTADQLRAYGLACFNAGMAEGGKDAERLEKKAEAFALLDALIDIYDDAQSKAPEHRVYIDSAWHDILDECRQLLSGGSK